MILAALNLRVCYITNSCNDSKLFPLFHFICPRTNRGQGGLYYAWHNKKIELCVEKNRTLLEHGHPMCVRNDSIEFDN